MIKLGKEAVDKVSGFKGVVVARHTFLSGCDRYTIQPRINDKDEMTEAHTFDEPQLVVLKKKKVKTDKNEKPGGPAPYLPSEKSTPKSR
jgi:hypothetical protein